ncbi:MAG: histidine phosphatase family protein [Actinobacteria bacterium]|nr:histidine phosphatase family protein [Actinomycetota bacterium]MBW3642061.1 histidine phosphatase family protein [Actinomycetota bacterium]
MSLHVVRHAKAGDRSEWHQADELRPLSRAGLAQAEALAGLLGTVPIKRILSSRYLRCTQTVAPLAERLGLDVEEHPALAEEADVAATLALLEELTGTEAVVCTHGNLIGPLLDRLHRRGVDLADRWVCKKGSVWTIEADDSGAFARARYCPPPA